MMWSLASQHAVEAVHAGGTGLGATTPSSRRRRSAGAHAHSAAYDASAATVHRRPRADTSPARVLGSSQRAGTRADHTAHVLRVQPHNNHLLLRGTGEAVHWPSLPLRCSNVGWPRHRTMVRLLHSIRLAHRHAPATTPAATEMACSWSRAHSARWPTAWCVHVFAATPQTCCNMPQHGPSGWRRRHAWLAAGLALVAACQLCQSATPCPMEYMVSAWRASHCPWVPTWWRGIGCGTACGPPVDPSPHSPACHGHH